MCGRKVTLITAAWLAKAQNNAGLMERTTFPKGWGAGRPAAECGGR